MNVEAVLKKLGIETSIPRGDRLWALCPYHDDSHPSWFIRWRGNRCGQHHCFSCQSGGTLIELVMHARKLDHDDAREWLGELGTDDEPEGIVAEHVRLEIRHATPVGFRLPREVVFDAPLEEWVTPARDYVIGRKISPAQIERWGIGYAVDGRLTGRIVVPVHDGYGRPANYMARTFANQARRYLYPRATESPDPDALFGEHEWTGPRVRIYVTEGAFNALAIERALGEVSVAAIGGSQVRTAHVSKLATFSEVVLVTDPDDAGDSAASELALALRRYAVVRRVRLPEDTDADSLAPDELRRRLLA